MDCLDLAKQYLDAWNAQDAEAIVATFAADGIYADPNGKHTGKAIGANAQRLWNAFPDLSFEVVSLGTTGPGIVMAEWIMRGTNTADFQGLPPTGRTVTLPGIDVFHIAEDGIKSVQGYFDSKVVPEQLGLQILVQPFQLGPFAFGYSVSASSGKQTKPGAFSVTSIWNKDEHTEEIRNLSRETAKEMLQMEGLIGVSMFRNGNRGVTISAWEKPEQTRQLMSGGTHGQAMRRFWEGLGDAAYTSVWVPHHINPLWVRCAACGQMSDYDKNAGACHCGATLPEPPAYF